MAVVYLGLGTNLGDRLAMLRLALEGLEALGEVVACSSVYETEPWGVADQPRFLNLCCALRTRLRPEELHAETRALEARLGRRPGMRWGPRALDVDLLAYDGRVIATERLSIPHPRIAERAFVLAPLAEIAPALRLPGLGGTVHEQLTRLGETARLAWIVAPPPRSSPSAS